MNTKFPTCFAWICLFLFVMTSASADPLADARRHIQRGEYAEAEDALSPLLDQDPPPLEALTLSFEAARRDGRVFTAERRIQALIERQGREQPNWIFQGALVARDMGDEARYLDRLMFFASQMDERSPELEQALRTLSLRSTFPQAFAQYRRMYGPRSARFAYGLEMLARIRSAGQPGPLLELAGMLLREAQTDNEYNQVVDLIAEALEQRMFGLERDAVFQLLAAQPVRDLSRIRPIVQRHNIELSHLMALQQAHNRPLPADLLRRFRELHRLDNDTLRNQLAREFVNLEPLYRRHAGAETYRTFAWIIADQARVFLPESGALVPENTVVEIIRNMIRMHEDQPERLHWVNHLFLRDSHRDSPHRFVPTAEQRLSVMRENLAAFRPSELREFIQGREADEAVIRAYLDRIGPRQEVWIDLVEVFSRHGHLDLLNQTVRREFRMNPANFPIQNLARHWLSNTDIPMDTKIAMLREGWEHSGNSSRFRDLVTHRDNRLRSEDPMSALAEEMREDRQASDPLLQLLVEISNDSQLRSGNTPRPEFTERLREAFQQYGQPFPSPDVSTERTRSMTQILNLYRETASRRREGRREFAEVISPHLSARADWEAHIEFTIDDNNNDGTSSFHTALAYTAIHNRWHDSFTNIWHPQENEDDFARAHFAEMPIEVLQSYLSRNRAQWSPAFLALQLAAALEAQSLNTGNPAHMRLVLEVLAENAEEAGDALPLQALREQFFRPLENGEYGGNWEIRRELQRLHVAAGRQMEGIEFLLTHHRDADPAAAATAISSLTGDLRLVPEEPEDSLAIRGHRRYILTQILPPLWEQIPDSDAARLFVHQWSLGHPNWLRGRRNVPETLMEEVNAAQLILTRKLAAGAPTDARWGDFVHAIQRSLDDRIAAGDMPGVISLVLLAGRTAENANAGQLRALVEPLQEAELFEPLFLLTQVVTSIQSGAQDFMTQTRNFASARVPGIFPVDADHPAYPLFLAAQELSLNNPEQAWNLLREHLDVFAEDPLRFPHSFITWALVRLRQVRGEDNIFLDRSLELSNLIVARPGELPVEALASVMLNRAEIFREQRNFDAARLEYQAIRTHPDFQRTPAGRQAMFRDVDLMIAMGNVSAAESLLEFWLANPDTDLQANAHYFNALIAFNNGDDDATREHLDRVFALNFTHTEARLLHGRWRLRTNFEIDNPEILLGDLRDRTILRPGQPLRITVQDPNLAVVGGGAAIPVLVTTSEGNDREILSLFPSTRDPRLFRGALDTVLGPATPGNRVLEVSGLDEIRFEIDPEFLSERGMDSSEARTLRIVDDAVLMVSAGNILTEAEQQALEIQRQMTGGREPMPQQGGDVRPGNPIFVMVRDRDQSRGGEGGTVTVHAETRSGDRIPNVVLRETAPYSGVFRGEIPTALPPPRASASDTADGTLAGNTINTNRSGVWRSRADGVQGKWLEADTMNSHLIQRVELLTPDAENISEIQLRGRLTGDWQHMGSIPERAMPGGGVQLQITRSNIPSIHAYREYFSRTRQTPVQQSTFRYEPEDRDRRIHLRGPFYLPESRTITFHLLPTEPDHNNAMRDAWLHLLVNGERIAHGRGSDWGRDEPISVTLPAGGHILEMFGHVRFERDGFILAYEDAQGNIVPLPEDWFSIDDNPNLVSFLSDRAQIRRTGTGFVAEFSEPVRLRSLRWEFLRYTGDSITVSEFRVLNTEGNTILPGPTDFTDALDNDILEIAPGDRITITYQDEHTTSGQRRILSRELGSRFTNGTIGFNFEVLTPTAQGMQSSLHPAFRFRPGDSFMVVVQDADESVSPEADTLPVVVTTRSGERLELTAVEQGDPARGGIHSGRFVALVRTTLDGTTGGDTLRVTPGDRITATYIDRENTNPGIPIERSVSLDSVMASEPRVAFFHTWREKREDTGPDAARRLTQIQARPSNQSAERIFTWDHFAMPMTPDEREADPVLVNVDGPFLVEVYHPAAAMHRGSRLRMLAVAESEIALAQAEGRDPHVLQMPLSLGRPRAGAVMRPNPDMPETPGDLTEQNAHFGGVLQFRLGQAAEGRLLGGDEAATGNILAVQGNDRVQIRIVDEDRRTVYRGNLQLASEASIALLDSSFQAERNRIHLGERFFVQVTDTKQDTTPGRDRITVQVSTALSGQELELELTETLPNSGVFTGVIVPEFHRDETAAADDEENLDPSLMGIPRIGVAFGDTITFRYRDPGGLPHRPAQTVEITGSIFDGSDGRLWAFTKQFDDPEMAVRVQFRLAESLFEMAKDYRRLDQRDRSASAIDEGKRILEEVLTNNPETALAVEGEYLLAHLYAELGAEAERDDPETAREFFQEALSRFSVLLSNHPDSAFAPRAQFQRALALERLGDFSAASEEYVKLTYIFPDSPLVGDASIRLATHFFRNEQRFDIAGRIFSNFASRFPGHPMAGRAMFMSAQSHMRQAETWEDELRAQGLPESQVKTPRVIDEYLRAVASFQMLIDDQTGNIDRDIRAQAMYWAGDASLRALDFPGAYLFLRRTVFEYPESEWARRARGLLLQSANLFEGLDS
jgi:tetratricopeptide (TPR) repeat protein